MNKAFYIFRIYELCKQKNLDIQSFVQKNDFVPNTIYAWEKLESIPSIKSLQKICNFFEIELAEFFHGYNECALTPVQTSLIEDWRQLSSNEKIVIQKIIQVFKGAD